jgi:hypothetical protein
MSTSLATNYRYLAAILQAVPAYTEAELDLARGTTVRGMARDLPTTDGSPRRWTVDAFEWFIDEATLERVEVVAIRLTVPELSVWAS